MCKCVCNREKYSYTSIAPLWSRCPGDDARFLLLVWSNKTISPHSSTDREWICALVPERDQAGRILLSKINHSLPRHKRAEALGLFLMEEFPGWWVLPTLGEDFVSSTVKSTFHEKNIRNVTKNSMKYCRDCGWQVSAVIHWELEGISRKDSTLHSDMLPRST